MTRVSGASTHTRWVTAQYSSEPDWGRRGQDANTTRPVGVRIAVLARNSISMNSTRIKVPLAKAAASLRVSFFAALLPPTQVAHLLQSWRWRRERKKTGFRESCETQRAKETTFQLKQSCVSCLEHKLSHAVHFFQCKISAILQDEADQVEGWKDWLTLTPSWLHGAPSFLFFFFTSEAKKTLDKSRDASHVALTVPDSKYNSMQILFPHPAAYSGSGSLFSLLHLLHTQSIFLTFWALQ